MLEVSHLLSQEVHMSLEDPKLTPYHLLNTGEGFVLFDLQDTTLHICHAISGNVGDQKHQEDRLLSSSHTK